MPPSGVVDPSDVAAATTPDTGLVSIMLAHNEIGVIQPIAEIAALAHERGALVHTDAVQALGKLPVDLHAMGVDLAAFSAHKVYGPKGVGALFVARGIEKRLRAIVDRRRPGARSCGGTLNVPGIVGFGAACAVAARELAPESDRLPHLRDRLWQGLRARVGEVTLNGAATPRLPGNLNVQVAGVEGESLLLGLTDIAVSTGAACLSAEPSHVLRGARPVARRGAGVAAVRARTLDDGGGHRSCAVAHVAEVVAHLRATSPAARARGGDTRLRAMASYSAAVLERVRNPQRVGSLPVRRTSARARRARSRAARCRAFRCGCSTSASSRRASRCSAAAPPSPRRGW